MDKDFLEKLEKHYKRYYKHFEPFIGSATALRLKRFLHFPVEYVKYILLKLGILKKIKIELFWGRKIIVRKINGLSVCCCFSILCDKSEEKLTKFFIKNLSTNDIFYDIGANFGFYSYLALEFCKEVHVFEPLSDVFDCLKENLSDTPNVFLNNVALSDKVGEAEFYVAGPCSTLRSNALGYFAHPDKTIIVKTIILDKYLENHNKPTIIKLDVEGAESFVIRGGINFLSNNNPIIAMEVWSWNNGGEISLEAINQLTQLGFKPYFINENGNLKLCNDDLTKIVELENLKYDNFIFKKW